MRSSSVCQVTNPRYEKRHNNPQWDLTTTIVLGRMDNSLSMNQCIATAETEDHDIEICHPLGGVAMIFRIKDKKGEKKSRTYYVELKSLVNDILSLDPTLSQTMKIKRPNK